MHFPAFFCHRWPATGKKKCMYLRLWRKIPIQRAFSFQVLLLFLPHRRHKPFWAGNRPPQGRSASKAECSERNFWAHSDPDETKYTHDDNFKRTCLKDRHRTSLPGRAAATPPKFPMPWSSNRCIFNLCKFSRGASPAEPGPIGTKNKRGLYIIISVWKSKSGYSYPSIGRRGNLSTSSLTQVVSETS